MAIQQPVNSSVQLSFSIFELYLPPTLHNNIKQGNGECRIQGGIKHGINNLEYSEHLLYNKGGKVYRPAA